VSLQYPRSKSSLPDFMTDLQYYGIRSVFLKDEHFDKIKEWTGKDEWMMTYSSSRDGYNANSFVESIRNQPESRIYVFKVWENSFIFGVYLSVELPQVNNENPGNYKCDPNAFIFSLENGKREHYKFPIKIENNAIYNNGINFLSIGGGGDISFNFYDGSCYTNFPNNYDCTFLNKNEGKKFLGGFLNFHIEELEVYI